MTNRGEPPTSSSFPSCLPSFCRYGSPRVSTSNHREPGKTSFLSDTDSCPSKNQGEEGLKSLYFVYFRKERCPERCVSGITRWGPTSLRTDFVTGGPGSGWGRVRELSVEGRARRTEGGYTPSILLWVDVGGSHGIPDPNVLPRSGWRWRGQSKRKSCFDSWRHSPGRSSASISPASRYLSKTFS